MRGRSTGAALAMAAALAAGLGGLATAASDATRAANEMTRTLNAQTMGMPNVGGFLNSLGILGSATGGGRNPFTHNPPSGWTNRRYQRAARKKRNVARNRAAHR